MLPHLKDRALTLVRYPEGVDQEFFFEKRCPTHRPEWVKTAAVRLEGEEEMTVCLVDDLPTLMWVANLAALELHVPLARTQSPDTPDALVFDLYPGAPANVLDCARVALILRDLLAPLKLTGYCKTSGKKGLHVFVPLHHPGTTFDDTKQFSRAVAEILQKNYPDLVTSRMAKEYRRGKVFINWSQNDGSKTMVGVYSLRGTDKPMVSFPLTWGEVEAAAGRGDAEMLQVLYARPWTGRKVGGSLSRGAGKGAAAAAPVTIPPHPSPLPRPRVERGMKRFPGDSLEQRYFEELLA